MSILKRFTRLVSQVGSIFQTSQPESALHRFERVLGKPVMRTLPAQSGHPDQTQAQKLETPAEFFDLVQALKRERGPVTIEAGGPVLVLVHGIFDRVFGAAFSPLLVWGDLLGRLQAKYDNRVFGFDHESLSVDPVQNARDLAARLPSNTEIDILCHSRGGLVTRALLQLPEFEADRKRFRLRNVIFMGAANLGSPLAEPGNTDELLEMFSHLFQARTPAEGHAAHLRLTIEAVRVLGRRAANLPGLAGLRPGSELIRSMEKATVGPGVKYSFICANFDNAADIRLRVPERISGSVFGSKLNDLVVPLEGMAALGAAPLQDAPVTTLDASGSQGDFYHVNYLDSPRVRQRITDFLRVP
jgi:hypothetical protein